MATTLSIGEFSRATHLTVKALRHYHERGLLVPDGVDPDSGYRYYGPGQISRGQLIRRLREMEMPLDEIRVVVDAPGDDERDAAITDHLVRMEGELERTREVVSSLRQLLNEDRSDVEVRWTTAPPLRAFARAAVVERDRIAPWCEETFPRIFRDVLAAGRQFPAPAGALFPGDFFERGRGEVTAFVPVAAGDGPPGGSHEIEIPKAHLGVAEHRGDYATLDQTYGVLAETIAGLGVGLDLPLRERYVVSVNDTDDPSGFVTEVCWPVSATAPGR